MRLIFCEARLSLWKIPIPPSNMYVLKSLVSVIASQKKGDFHLVISRRNSVEWGYIHSSILHWKGTFIEKLNDQYFLVS